MQNYIYLNLEIKFTKNFFIRRERNLKKIFVQYFLQFFILILLLKIFI